jgi:hypothetical protein
MPHVGPARGALNQRKTSSSDRQWIILLLSINTLHSRLTMESASERYTGAVKGLQ